MARTFRISGYLVDGGTEFENGQELIDIMDEGFSNMGLFCHQLHVEKSEEYEWDDDLPENEVNCDMDDLEKRFVNDTSGGELDVLVGGTYRHFKGKTVKVIALSRHSERPNELTVVYKCENGRVFNRPYDMFVSKVDKEKYPDVEQEYRFSLVDF